MKLLKSLILFFCATTALQLAVAQTEVPQFVPPRTDNLPQPFGYPPALASPTFDQSKHIGDRVDLGDFSIDLGQTPLSLAVEILGGKIYFTSDKTPFLCYSSPVKEPPSDSKKKTKVSEEIEATTAFQNIWLMVGSSGKISEARIQKSSDLSQKCPSLLDMYNGISVGGISINDSERQIEKAKIPEFSAKSEDPERWYWFSLLPSKKKGYNNAGLMSVKFEDGKVDQIISVMVPLQVN